MKLPIVTTAVQLRFSDTDAQGHVSATSYLEYLELGRAEFFLKIRESEDVINNAVVNVNIDYLSEVVYGEDVKVKTWCSRKGNKSLTMSQELFAGERLALRASTTVVGFDLETRTSIAFPVEWEASSLGEDE